MSYTTRELIELLAHFESTDEVRVKKQDEAGYPYLDDIDFVEIELVDGKEIVVIG